MDRNNTHFQKNITAKEKERKKNMLGNGGI